MQSVSSSLTAEQRKNDQRYYRIIELYKRYWNGSAFVWDTAVDISGYVNRVSTAKWKLDTNGYNEWKSPSFQLEVDNPRNIWSTVEVTGKSIWKTGAHQPYELELSRVRVRCGQYLADGSMEDKYVFGGIITRPIQWHESRRTATVYVTGMDELLRRTPAYPGEDGSGGLKESLVTLEELGADAGTEFTTIAGTKAVGGFIEVRRGTTAGGSAAATVLDKGTDYDESQTNSYNDPGKITLKAALTAGNSVWATYYTWYTDKDISWVVTQLLGLASISSYQVDPTIFANAVKNTWTRTTTADFEGGTLTNAEARSVADAIRKKWYLVDNFDSGLQALWTNIAGATISSGKLVVGGNSQNGPIISMAHTKQSCSWDMKVTHIAGAPYFMMVLPFMPASGTGYGFYVNPPTGGNNNQIALGGSDRSGIGIGSGTLPDDGSEHTVRITLQNNGSTSDLKLYLDTVLIATATISSIDVAGFGVWNSNPGAGTGDCLKLDDIYVSDMVDGVGAVSTSSPIAVSSVLDAGVSLTAFGKVLSTYTLNGCTLTIETLSASAADFLSGVDPAGWVAVSTTGQINSAVLRYLMVRITINGTPSIADISMTAEIQDFAVEYYTSTTVIQMVNMTGLNAWTGIEACAALPSYEIGFNANEKFFYRARSTSLSPVVIFDKDNHLAQEISFDHGQDKVKNRATASFGQYQVIVDSNTQGEAHPNSIDRRGVLNQDVSGNLLPASSVNVAGSVALTVFDYLSVEKKRAQVETKFLLQLELGDPTLYKREHKFGRWLWGDRDRRYGDYVDPDFEYYPDPSTNGWDLTMRIEGMELDTEPGRWRARYDLVEIN